MSQRCSAASASARSAYQAKHAPSGQGATWKFDPGSAATPSESPTMSSVQTAVRLFATAARSAETKLSSTPMRLPVTLPAEGTATVKIDGEKLEKNVEYVLLNSVPTGYADHLTVTGTALDGCKYKLKEKNGALVLNIKTRGLVIIFR